MKNKLLHPLWVHIPAALVFITLVISIIIYGPYPSDAPVHFGTNGIPDRTGSPWEVIGITLGLCLFFIGLSVFFDELWIKQETRKTFNWFTFLDEIVVGAMTGFTIDYLRFLDSGAAEYHLSWVPIVLTAGAALLLGLVLERLRPFRPHPELAVPGESAELKAAISDKLERNAPFVFWDIQNPGWMSLVTVLLPIVMIVTAIFSWTSEIWVSVVLLIVGLLLVLPNGGQRIMVTRNYLLVRWGLIGIKVLKLEMKDISSASLREFSPLKDFGGYGIRFNREMKAYFLRGSLGVLVETGNGKKYLLGSDRPEDLYTVLSTAAGN